jgi:hypothetical protein
LAAARNRPATHRLPRQHTQWVDGTAVGGCSFMIHVGHAAAAFESGLDKTVLTTHGESGRCGVGRTRNIVAQTSRLAAVL